MACRAKCFASPKRDIKSLVDATSPADVVKVETSGRDASPFGGLVHLASKRVLDERVTSRLLQGREGGTEMRIEADARTIARAQRDRAAFGEIFDMYARRIYAFCRAYATTHEDAEDLMAQTFEHALRAIDQYEDRGLPFSAWLLRIAANTVAAWARRNKRSILVTSPASIDEGPTLEVTVDSWVARWERAYWLQGHMRELPADYQTVLRLRFVEDKALGEIAAQMRRSNGATKKLLRRALAAFRARIAQEEDSVDDVGCSGPQAISTGRRATRARAGGSRAATRPNGGGG